VSSDYFDGFTFSTKSNAANTELDLGGIDKDQNDEIFKSLIKQLQSYVVDKRDNFLKENSDTAINRFEKRDTLPVFGEDAISQSRKEDYLSVLKGVYKTAPTLFVDISKQQEKSLLGFLNLTLKSDERESVLDIISSVVDLSPEDREELAQLLKKTKLSGVVKLLKTLESRYSVVELLRMLVFKLTKSTTERGQLQSAIENNFWLFGEEYNMVGADSAFKQLEGIYLSMIDEKKISEDEKSDRRPDVFLTRARKMPSGIGGSTYKMQNLIVELKRPSVDVGIEQYRQVEDYMHIIKSNPNLNGSLREWHMFVIGVKVKSEITSKREAFKHLNRQFLVNHEENFYIYALSWADVFDAFEIRHDYLLDDLEIDKNMILEDIKFKQELYSSQEIADEIVKIGKNDLAVATGASMKDVPVTTGR
jgi:hypothetical protein